MYSFGLVLTSGAGLASAYQLSNQLRDIYEAHRSGECTNILTGGFSDGNSGSDVSYCGDLAGAIFLHTSSDGGTYADMDVDCDGADNGAGACSNDPSGQGMTAFKDQVSQYGISDLNANIHPYVVFGNEGAIPSFDPRQYGMEPLSIMAVVCNGNLHYGIWGDTNGGVSTGEASISLARLCFPNAGITGDNGHGEKDVLYVGFIGKDAVPGASADWQARDTESFENSIKSLGDNLVASLGGNSLTGTPSSFGLPTPSAPWSTTTPTPSWTVSSSWAAPRWKPDLWRRKQA